MSKKLTAKERYVRSIPKGVRGNFTVSSIRKMRGKNLDKYYEYHKRIMMLRALIKRFPKNKFKYAQEIMECQDEQKKLISESYKEEREEEKRNRL